MCSSYIEKEFGFGNLLFIFQRVERDFKFRKRGKHWTQQQQQQQQSNAMCISIKDCLNLAGTGEERRGFINTKTNQSKL